MRINIVSVGSKFAVCTRTFFGKPVFYSKTGEYTQTDMRHVISYCLFDKREDAQILFDILSGIKSPLVIG